MSVHVFFDPHRVEQLRQQGIGPRRQLTSGSMPETKTALERRVFEPGREVGDGLELVEECARLRAEIDRFRRDNQRLSDEVARLTIEATHRPDSSRSYEGRDLDDSERRFALIELDL